MQQKYFLIYKITNLINDKIYIGQHTTSNKNDNYMGSGKLIKLAIKKYGIENFTKEILFELNSEKELDLKEKELITTEFCLLDNTYNICEGGFGGGFRYINRTRNHQEHSLKIAQKRSYKEPKLIEWLSSDKKKEITRETHKQGKFVKNYFHNRLDHKECLLKAQSDEVKQKIKDTYKKIGHQQGSKNSQYGKPRSEETKQKIRDSLANTRELNKRPKNIDGDVAVL